MELESGSTEELIKRARQGGQFRVEAGLRPVEELVSIAQAATAHGGRATFFGLGARHFSELLRIALAGGCWDGRLPKKPYEQSANTPQLAICSR